MKIPFVIYEDTNCLLEKKNIYRTLIQKNYLQRKQTSI